MLSDSSGSSDRSHSSSSRYDDLAARRFKAELEWEHQRKQLLEAIDGESCDLFNFNSTLN
jgi:hypothetical protein